MDAVEGRNVGSRHILRKSLLVLALLGALGTIVGTSPAAAQGQGPAVNNSWHVSASAAPGGDGSAALPFNTLSAVQAASAAGDTIIVDPSPTSVPPLDGGIALKSGQRLIGGGPPVVQMAASLIPGGPPLAVAATLASLPRVTNSTNATNSGDAVRLANNTDVENLVIVAPFRGGVYGNDVIGATIRGNDISGFNTSGATGFVVSTLLRIELYRRTGRARKYRHRCWLGGDPFRRLDGRDDGVDQQQLCSRRCMR